MDIEVLDEQTLRCGEQQFRCAIGKHGFVAAEEKREGDGKTPRGRYAMRACYYRPDKFECPPSTVLPVVALRPDMGWCDDPQHPRYNQLVSLPFATSHEKLWRDDATYDLIVPLGYNDDPIVAGKGSAIFLHVAKPSYSGTEGCLALGAEDVLALLKKVRSGQCVQI